jgi:hypothetical protein
MGWCCACIGCVHRMTKKFCWDCQGHGQMRTMSLQITTLPRLVAPRYYLLYPPCAHHNLVVSGNLTMVQLHLQNSSLRSFCFRWCDWDTGNCNLPSSISSNCIMVQFDVQRLVWFFSFQGFIFCIMSKQAVHDAAQEGRLLWHCPIHCSLNIIQVHSRITSSYFWVLGFHICA